MTKKRGKKIDGKAGSTDRKKNAQKAYEQGLTALEFDDYDLARTCLKRAAQIEPNNAVYVDALGALLAEIGPPEEALLVLRHAVNLNPDVGFEKFLYLGQLLEGKDALEATQKGVQVLQRTYEDAVSQGRPEADELRPAFLGALCSCAEQLLNEAEEVAHVESQVEQMLTQAASLDPLSPEPGQALASLRCEQGRGAEALELLRASMKLWHKPEEEKDDDEADDEGMGTDDEGDDEMEDDEEAADDDDEEGPSYEFRVECAKLLLELDESTAAAIDVLEGLVEEDDSNPDTWHLLALAFYSGQQYTEAVEVIAKGRQLIAKLGLPSDAEVVALFGELEHAIAEAQQDGGAAASEAAAATC